MPAEIVTEKLKLNQWQGNEYPKRQDFVDDNKKIDDFAKSIDEAVKKYLTAEQAGELYSKLNHRHNASDIDNITPIIVNTKVNNASHADSSTNADKLDGLDSTQFMREYRGDGNVANDLGVSQYMRWKHYGQGHVIFDASQGTAPNGISIDRTNAQIGWAATYPTLMGWNGQNTYGVRVDQARKSDVADVATVANSVQGFQFRNNNGQLEVLVGGVWLSVGAKQYTVKRDFNIRADGHSRFEYYGSGILKKLGITGSQDTKQFIYIYLDDVFFSYDDSDVGYINMEFKNSFKVISKEGYATNVGVYGFIQTEK